jgi:hypothetical protein
MASFDKKSFSGTRPLDTFDGFLSPPRRFRTANPFCSMDHFRLLSAYAGPSNSFTLFRPPAGAAGRPTRPGLRARA